MISLLNKEQGIAPINIKKGSGTLRKNIKQGYLLCFLTISFVEICLKHTVLTDPLYLIFSAFFKLKSTKCTSLKFIKSEIYTIKVLLDVLSTSIC